MPTLNYDQKTFQAQIEPYRRELQFHCYRMTGSFHDAEDLVQETLLRAWHGIGRFEGRGSLRGWLYRIATNACLNALTHRRRRVLPEFEGPPNLPIHRDRPSTEIAWLEPYPDVAMEEIADTAPGPEARFEMQETVQLAFVAAIQHLPPRQRAALLLCDVIGWPAVDTAALLETTTASVNSALQRARTTLAQRSSGNHSHVKKTSDEQQHALVKRYMQTWEQKDLPGFAALLREDAVLSMPPWPQWFLGRTAIRDFFSGAWSSADYGAFRGIATAANRQPAWAVYSRALDTSEFRAHSIHVLTVDSDTIAGITLFLESPLFSAFGLPDTLAEVDVHLALRDTEQ